VKHYSQVTAEIDQSKSGRTTAAFLDFDWTTDNIHEHVERIRRMYLGEAGQTRDEDEKLRRVK
jgi:hypothetical protein